MTAAIGAKVGSQVRARTSRLPAIPMDAAPQARRADAGGGRWAWFRWSTPNRAANCWARVKSLRKNLALQTLGFLVPSIHITDNLALPEREYVVYLRGVEIAPMGATRCGRLLAISSQPGCAGDLPGQETREPAFNTASSLDHTASLQAQAIAAGYAVVDPVPRSLAAHLG